MSANEAMGLAESAALFGLDGGSWLGEPVDGHAALVRRTLKGDSNLDLLVDFNDLLRWGRRLACLLVRSTKSNSMLRIDDKRDACPTRKLPVPSEF